MISDDSRRTVFTEIDSDGIPHQYYKYRIKFEMGNIDKQRYHEQIKFLLDNPHPNIVPPTKH